MAEKAKKNPLSETELEVLKVLWEIGSGTVREINELLGQRKRRWAHTTVLTLLTRLEAKGYVEIDKSSFAHVFRPLVSRDNLLRERLAGLAQELCEGAPTPLVHALVQGQQFSTDEIKRFRQLLDEVESQAETRTQKSPRKPKS